MHIHSLIKKSTLKSYVYKPTQLTNLFYSLEYVYVGECLSKYLDSSLYLFIYVFMNLLLSFS